MKHSVVSLFSGAGGLDLGLETAGFAVALCVESDADCRATIARNRPRWVLSDPGDIHALSPEEVLRQASLRRRHVTLVAGGPPCQPFSKSSYWRNGDSRRLADPRARTLDEMLAIVRVVLPHCVLVENVSGLGYADKDEGLVLIKRGLEKINRSEGVKYYPQVFSINTADYGVPQLRERLFVLAHRAGRTLKLPNPTHHPATDLLPPNTEPYRTAWDAIGDLDTDNIPEDLLPTGKWARLLPSIPEGENYLWHTPRSQGEPLFGWRTRFWSFLLKLAKDRPSWTIQAQPGPATGPFHWRSRKLSTRELCRLQTFPDSFSLEGGPTSQWRQVGNAVPPAIGELLGLEIRRQFFNERMRKILRLIPQARPNCPPPERRGRVPREYLNLRRNHEDHPGKGLGPSARERAAAE